MINLNLLSAPILGRSKFKVLPQNLLTSPGTLYEDFETVGDWTAGSGSVAADAVNFKTGTKGVALTTNAGATATMTKTVSWDLSGAWGRMIYWFKLNNPLALYNGSFMVMLSNDASFTNYMRGWIAYTNMKLTGWHTMSWAKGDFGAVAGGTFANPIIRVRFQVVAAAAQTPSVTFDSLYFGLHGIPAVMLRFDDGYLSTYTKAFPYMQPHQIRGTLSAETDFVGTGGKLTWAQAVELDAAGWTISNHTNASTNLPTLTEAQQEAQILGGKNGLIAQGLSRCADYVVYPGGNLDANTQTACEALGALAGWTSHPTTIQGEDLLALPKGQMLHLPSNGIPDSTSLATATGYVDKAIAGGYAMPFSFHDIGGAGQWSEATFQQFIDYLVTKKSQIAIITQDDFYRATLGPVMVRKIL